VLLFVEILHATLLIETPISGNKVSVASHKYAVIEKQVAIRWA